MNPYGNNPFESSEDTLRNRELMNQKRARHSRFLSDKVNLLRPARTLVYEENLKKNVQNAVRNRYSRHNTHLKNRNPMCDGNSFSCNSDSVNDFNIQNEIYNKTVDFLKAPVEGPNPRPRQSTCMPDPL
jgi:hypothetical protein